MADEFQVGVCGGNMWNISRSNFFGSSPCSMVVNDIGWPSNQDSSVIIMDMKSPSKSNEDSSTSTDHIWSQNLLFNGGRTEDNNYIDIFLQEATCLNSISTMNYWQEETSFFDCPQFLVDSSLINSSTFSSDLTISKSCQEPSQTPKFPINSSQNSYSSSLSSQNIDSQLRQSVSPINNLISNDGTSSCMPSKNSLFDLSSINDKNKPINLQIVNGKVNEEAYVTKESEVVPVTYKRPRIEPLPTFKVRKEKFGDRVTALQQLVSPFGKTDTASVLHEAIEYIKFLHNQVKNLSSPYLDYGSRRLQLRDNQTINDHNNDSEEQKLLQEQDLRSRGLCLVPISSTLSVAAETSADLWPPTFNGPASFR